MPSNFTKQPVILITLSTFSIKTGATGPAQSIKSMIEMLGEDFNFVVLSRSQGPNTGIDVSKFFVSGTNDKAISVKSQPTVRFWKKTLNSISPDIIYCGSFFDFKYTTLLVIAAGKSTTKSPIIISPRGEFTSNALSQKAFKKGIFIKLCTALNIFKDITFHATSIQEKEEIKKVINTHAQIFTAHDTAILPQNSNTIIEEKSSVDKKKILKGVFLGRISPIKNIEFIVNTLSKLEMSVEFDWYGEIQDYNYFNKLEKSISLLPEHIVMSYRKVLNHDQVAATLHQYDFLFAPSKSESFGHVIFEALSCGLPVLIGENTPWKNLYQSNAGLNSPLTNTKPFTEYLSHLNNQNTSQRENLKLSCKNYVQSQSETWMSAEKTREMFLSVLL